LTEAEGFYERLSQTTNRLVTGIAEIAAEYRVPMATNHVTGMFGLFFTDVDHVTNFQHATACDTERFKRFFHGMLAEGVYLAPSPFEAGFVSSSHDDTVISRTLDAVGNVFRGW